MFFHIKSQTATNVTIEVTLSHPSGNQISTEGTFSIDGQGSKNHIQSVGSTIIYALRYLLGMFLNVTSEEDDTDGNMLIADITPKQMNEIEELMEQTQSEKNKMLSFIGVKNLTDMSY
ncbi:ERF family protein [Bartonella sp. F02]|uniref:ERF family protein n=1 Tax=Bartonella sp. F02 TaxID=2967262 RepID=UPI003FA498EE